MAIFPSNKATFINELQALLVHITGVDGVTFKFRYDEWSHNLNSVNLGLDPFEYNERFEEVIPLEENLFLSVCISWYKKQNETKDGNSKIKNVSLIFFHLKELLCKAEWAFEEDEDDTPSEHPQPHWHFVKDFGGIVEKPIIQPNGFIQECAKNGAAEVHNRFGEEPQPEQQKSSEIIEDNFSSKRMHFAMCSRWTEAIDANPRFEGRNQLFNWIEFCIKSIKEQHELHGK